MTLPFYFKGKLGDAILISVAKQRYEQPNRCYGLDLPGGKYERRHDIHRLKRNKPTVWKKGTNKNSKIDGATVEI